MGWIRDRILAEKKKHEGHQDWARLAEIKIINEIEERHGFA